MNSTSRVIILLIIIIPIICSIALNAVSSVSAQQVNDYIPVGGAIIPINKIDIFIPWMSIITAISLIIVIVSLKGKEFRRL